MCKDCKCGKTFVSDSGLKRHNQHQLMDFQSEVCGREFPFWSELATHQTIHSEEKCSHVSTQDVMGNTKQKPSIEDITKLTGL